MPDILSPIILSKKDENVSQEQLYLKGYIKNDIFDIYVVENNTNQPYCDKLKEYLCPSSRGYTYRNKNAYYKCNQLKDETISVSTNNRYIVIEFINPTSFINMDGTKYMLRKITFHTPSYHYVSDIAIKGSDTSSQITSLLQTIDQSRGQKVNNEIHNCMEIECMCSDNTQTQKLIVSTLCGTNTNDKSTNENIAELNNNAVTIINNYLLENKKNQLESSGYRNSKYDFNCIDFFPKKKQFYKYNGTTFKTNSTDISYVTRIVFEEQLVIPNIFYENIKKYTINPQCHTDLPINQFINIDPNTHNVIYSDTDIDFNSLTNKTKKKKNNKTTLYVILILFVLFLLIILFFTWKEGILKNALKEIFKENEAIYSIMIRYI
jgi:carbonic anhydrase